MGKVLDRLSGLALRYWAFLAASFALSFAFKVLAARSLGPQAYGAFSIGLGLATFLSFVSELGFPYALTKFIAEHAARDERREVAETLSSCFAVLALSGLAAGLALYLASDRVAELVYRDPSLGKALAAFALAVPLYNLFEGVQYALRGLQRQDHEGAVKAFGALVQLAVAAALLGVGASLWGVVSAVLVAFAASALAGLALIARDAGGLRPAAPSAAALRRAGAFALPLGLSNVFATVSELVDSAVIARVGGTPAATGTALVGAYQACFPFTVSLANLGAFVGPLVMPLASGLSSSRDEGRLRRLFAALVRYPWFALLPVSVLVAGAAEPLVALLYAERFGQFLPEMASMSALLAFAVLLQMLAVLFFQLAGGLGRSREVLAISLAYLALLASLDAALVPRLGILGAATARLCATGAAVALYLRLLSRELGRPSLAGVPTSLALGLVAVAAMRAVTVASPAAAILARAAVGLVVYAPAFLWLCTTEEDRAFARELWGSLRGGTGSPLRRGEE